MVLLEIECNDQSNLLYRKNIGSIYFLHSHFHPRSGIIIPISFHLLFFVQFFYYYITILSHFIFFIIYISSFFPSSYFIALKSIDK